jgi:hypothetical protein
MKASKKEIATIAAALALSITLAVGIVAAPAYACGDCGCDSSDLPPFKEFPDAAGATGNPHTCQYPTGDPHLDEDNPPTGNPHNT